MTRCAPCQSLDCSFPSDLELYSLQGLQFFLNGQLYPVIFCPTGYNCNPSLDYQIFFKCCNRTLSRPVNSGMSYDQIQALVKSMYNECVALNCSDMPTWPTPPKFYFNAEQVVSGSCMSDGGVTSTFVSTAPAGMFVASSQAIADAAAAAYAKRNYLQPFCNLTPKMQGNPGWCCLGADLDADPEANTYLVTGPNSGSDFTFDVTGTLPPGTTLDKETNNSAVLGGVPTVPGFYSYTVKATRTDLPTIYTSVTDTFAVFGITNPTLPNATVGTAYSEQLLTAGGTTPITFALHSGAIMPAGLTLHSDGLIDGTPTLAGVVHFNVDITDADGGACTALCTIEIDGPASNPDWSYLAWTTSVNFSQNGATTILTPNNTTGDSFHQQCSTPGWGVFGPVATAGTRALFTIPYNGTGQNCNLHIVYALTGAWQHGPISIQINRPGYAALMWTVPANTPGTYDIPFHINDTLGATVNITGFVSMQINDNSGFFPFDVTTPFTIDVQGTFSNI